MLIFINIRYRNFWDTTNSNIFENIVWKNTFDIIDTYIKGVHHNISLKALKKWTELAKNLALN